MTVVFADMTGSTPLQERMDPETVRTLMGSFYVAMRAEIEHQGGVVSKFEGDGVMAVFGLRETREDDALRALEASLGMLNAIDKLSDEFASGRDAALGLKCGVNTGEIVVGEEDEDLVGDAINVAKRLEGAALPGEVIAGEETWRLTRSSASFEAIEALMLKGKSEPVPAYRLLSLERAVEASTATFVGRDAELQRLVGVFDDAVADASARLVTIIGSPGLGKTRLARELANVLEERATVLEARCDAAGGATFAPIADVLRMAIGIGDVASAEFVRSALTTLLGEPEPDDRVISRVGALLGAGEPGTTEETFWGVRRVLGAMARRRPIVVMLDDLHWAEPVLLDLVEHIAEWIQDAPVLLVATARPELRELRPAFVEGGRAAAVLALEGLNDEATQEMACALLGTDECPYELVTRLPSSTEGNPLFVGELVRMLVDDGILMKTDGRWQVTVNVDAIEVPPTIQSLLAARVDRLRADERTVLELASVIGKEFYRGALVELAPAEVRDALDTLLEGLRRKELVESAGTYWVDEPVYQFHHVLIRDAAYRRLLKGRRAELHECVADWLERKTVDSQLGEHEEQVAYHLEQAHESRRQLGPLDDHGIDLGRRAAALLGSAAQRALDLDDLPAASSLSGRALDRLDPGDDARAALLLVRCEALLATGDISLGAPAVAEFVALGVNDERMTAWGTCFASQLTTLTDPSGVHETADRVSSAADKLTSLGDLAGAAKAHFVHALTLALMGQVAACEQALDDALTAARSSGDRRRLTETLGMAPLAALWGPSPVSRAGGRCLDIVRLLRITTGSPAVEAVSTRCQAVLEAFRGRADAARRMLRSARGTLEELGLRHGLLEANLFSGIVELAAADFATAEIHLRAAHDGFKAMGVDRDAGRAAALLARAHFALGELDDADRYASESERLAGEDLKAAMAWRGVRAEILAARGECDEARRLAEEAVELASGTDALIDHGDACLAQASVLRACGDVTRARAAADQAAALYERKGATALVERAKGAVVAQSAVRPTPIKSAVGLENAAVRTAMRTFEIIGRRDWDALAGAAALDLVMEDRRPGLATVVRGPESLVEWFEQAADLGRSNLTGVPVAVRGDRLALMRIEFSDEARSAVTELLLLGETDDAGHGLRAVLFDRDDLDAALDELNDRFVAAEGKEFADEIALVGRLMAAVDESDVAVVNELTTDDLVVLDHRPVSLGEIRGAAAFLAATEGMAGLVPGMRAYLAKVHRMSHRGGVGYLVNHGATPDGSPVIVEGNIVLLLDGRRASRIEIFPVDDRGAAIARFDELTAATQTSIATLENECTRVYARVCGAVVRRDWDTYLSLLSEDVVADDRRRTLVSRLEGRDASLAQATVIAELGLTAIDLEPIAIRGERLCLLRIVYRGVGPDGEPINVETLSVREIDEQGMSSLGVNFDPDDLDAALAELEDRFVVGEGAAYRLADYLRGYRDVTNKRDWERLRAIFADDMVVVDHRPASLGEIRGGDAYIPTVRAMVELIPDLYSFAMWVEFAGQDCMLSEQKTWGVTPDGDSVDVSILSLSAYAGDVIQRIEFFPPDQIAEARARLQELSTPSRELATEASRVVTQFIRLFERREWDGVRAGLASDSIFEDRRPGLSVRSDGRDAVLAMLHQLADVGVTNVELTTLAVRGERLWLATEIFSGPKDDPGSFEAECLVLHEINEQGELVTTLLFDPDDLSDVLTEFDDRYITGEGSPYADGFVAGLEAALNKRDWEGAHRVLASDHLLVDHRPASLGRIEGIDAFIRAVRPMTELAPDLRWLARTIHRINERGNLLETMAFGHSSDGAPVELRFLLVAEIRNGLISRQDVFSLDQFERALARFDELSAASHRTGGVRLAPHVPDGPWRTWCERWRAAALSKDWESFGTVVSANCTITSYQAGQRFELHGREEAIASVRAIYDRECDFVWEVLDAKGLVVLARVEAFGTGDEGWELSRIIVWQLDAAGAEANEAEFFDESDIEVARARFEEFSSRAGVAAVENACTRVVRRLFDRTLAQDWSAVAECYAEDVRAFDRRPMFETEGFGRRDSVSACKAIARIGVEEIEITPLAIRGDRLALSRFAWRGRVDLEVETIAVYEVNEAHQISYGAMYEPTNMREAIADLESRYLSGEAAEDAGTWAANVDLIRTLNAQEWDDFRSHFSPDVVIVDRQRPSLVPEDLDGLIPWVRTFYELMPDSYRLPVRIEAVGEGCAVCLLSSRGTSAEGNVNESLFYLLTVRERGLFVRLELFREDDAEAARSRFAELEADVRPTQTLENQSARVAARFTQLFNDRDFEAIAAMNNDGSVFEDRRPGLTTVQPGRDAQLAQVKVMADMGTQQLPPLVLATRGERLVLLDITWTVPSAAEIIEIRTLMIHEIDEDERIAAVLMFEGDDIDAAFDELDCLYAQTLDAERARVIEMARAISASFAARDWDRFRATFAPDATFVNHSPASSGAYSGAEFASSSAVTWAEVVPDLRLDVVEVLEVEPNCALLRWLMSGTNDSGGSVEVPWISVWALRDGQISRAELFPYEQIEEARARFEELDPPAWRADRENR